jgi:hypothetical protein
VRRRNAAHVDRHSISRRARLFAVTCFVLLLAPVLPVAVSGFGHGVQLTPVDRAAVRTAVTNRPVPGDPRLSARHEIAEAQLGAQRAQLARAAAAKAAAIKAAAARAAAAKARAALGVARSRAARERKAAPTPGHTGRGASGYSGRNRMWYPALGMSYSVSWFPCSRSRAPDNFVYRWGCAGSNNVYLMGHAWGRFSPLYRAYYGGRLARGQLLVYADNSGHIHRFRLSWWRTYPPLTSASWAWVGQSRSSATLQTCVGANSSLRLFVRFVEV